MNEAYALPLALCATLAATAIHVALSFSPFIPPGVDSAAFVTALILSASLLVLSVIRHLSRQRPDDGPWIRAARKILSSPIKERHALPVEILPHLMLGDKKSASDVAVLEAFRISHVLNAAGHAGRQSDEVLQRYTEAGIKLLQLDAQDEEGYAMLPKHRKTAADFFALAANSGGRCLVHCVAGINRSGVLAASELMLHERLPLLEAIRRIKAARGFVLSNDSFLEQLVTLARAEGLLGPPPPVEEQESPRPPRKTRPSVASALRGLG
ncbi:hypothetical protein AB1Y20_000156 [Prymnesium parvum]|uniref:protein-serine/threonine phosphatase n=1 Tax=Prymnesium parvum TaxID=97485 RepID=A0AB34K7M2_PRYPA